MYEAIKNKLQKLVEDWEISNQTFWELVIAAHVILLLAVLWGWQGLSPDMG